MIFDQHSLIFGGAITAHAATRIAGTISKLLEASCPEEEVRFQIGDLDFTDQIETVIVATNRYGCADQVEQFTVPGIRTYLARCAAEGVPAHISFCTGEAESGLFAIDGVLEMAEAMRLSGRFNIGAHYDGNCDLCPPYHCLFGAEAPWEGAIAVDLKGRPMLALTDDMDARQFGREAERIRNLFPWQPPALTAAGSLLDELEDELLAA